jgi:hypothetical protein
MKIEIYRAARRKWLADVKLWKAKAEREGDKWLWGDWFALDLLRARGAEIRRLLQN